MNIVFGAIVFVAFMWLVLSFIELPMDNKIDWVEYWQSKENKWKGKEQ